MKLLFFAIFLMLMQVTPQALGHARNDDAKGGTVNASKENKGKATSPSPVQNIEQGHVVVDRLPDKDKWDKVYIVLTAALVLIGAFTLGVIWYQAVQTRKATQAMERSTGILMQVERARIITYWDQVIHMDLSPTGVHDGRLEHCFNWCCANSGRTPARLTGVWSRFIAADKLSDLPENPVYDIAKERVYEGEPLEPHSKERQTVWFSTPLETDLPFDDMEKKSRSGQCFLYAYGYARYRDVWENPHVARFGVVRVITDSIRTDYWMIGGPSAYNRSE